MSHSRLLRRATPYLVLGIIVSSAARAEPAAGNAAAADLAPSEEDVYSGRAGNLGLDGIENVTLFDHEDRDISQVAEMEQFQDRCQDAYRRAVWRERRSLPPYLYADPLLDHVRLGDRAKPNDPRIVYFIGAHRPTATIMVSRLLLALYHHSHLFLIHVDLKADEKVMAELTNLTARHPNIHIMRTRRLVQWGAWTMVVTMLDAIASLVKERLDFDFVINLSDVDVSLRTNDEIVDFLRPYKGRQFAQVHQGTGEWLEKARNFTAKHVVVECGGFGHVALNSSDLDLVEARRAIAEDDDNVTATHTGSQWVIIDARFARYLVSDPRALRWQRVFESRFLSDESFVQTVLMHSPFNRTLVNHNMRYIYWPHFDGDPAEYWMKMGYSFVGGPQVINSSAAPGVFRSPYMFARKVDPTVDADTVRQWDVWMKRKLGGWRPDDQQLLGGAHHNTTGAPLERGARAAGPAGSNSGGGGGGGAGVAPRQVSPRDRRVQRVFFEDGSSCECGERCADSHRCCDDWPELCRLGTAADASPPCPAPADPPLSSAARNGTAIRLTFLNHAHYPLKLYHCGGAAAADVEVGVLQPGGRALTFETSDAHAWAARSFGGVTVLELPPREGRRTSTVDIYECDLHASQRRLHRGWR